MRITLIMHIIAGGLGLGSGFLALYTAKGAPLHRRAGTLFVYTMIAMALGGFAIAAVYDIAPAVNVPAALLTLYLVTTGLTTFRPATPRWFELAGMVVGLGVGATAVSFGFGAVAAGGTHDGIPAFPYFLLGTIGLLGALGDYRMIRSDGSASSRRGSTRVARHLWRMCFALFIAAMSFFLGQAKVIPEPLRIPPLLATPVLAVLATMFYWLWRVQIRRVLVTRS